jgi:hypothetical protein
MSNQFKEYSKESSFLLDFDMFGEDIIFTFKGLSRVKTVTGLIMTILYITTAAVMFYFLGQGFLIRINPNTTYSSKNFDTIGFYNTTLDKQLFLAFRVRQQGRSYNLDGRLYEIRANFIRPNKKTQEETVTPLLVRECRFIPSLDINYLQKTGLSEPNFFCLPLNFPMLGADITHNDYSYVNFVINFCLPGGNTKCVEALSRILNEGYNEIIVDTYYPELFYDPNNYEDPFKINHVRVSDSYLNRNAINREIFLKQSTLFDDKGFLLEDTNENILKSVYYTSGYKESKQDEDDLKLYSAKIYVTSFFEEYYRSYQKIQDVIAVVGGFLQICQLFLTFAISFYLPYIKAQKLIDGVINWKVDTDEKNVNAVKFRKQNTIMRELSEFGAVKENNYVGSPVRKMTKNNNESINVLNNSKKDLLDPDKDMKENNSIIGSPSKRASMVENKIKRISVANTSIPVDELKLKKTYRHKLTFIEFIKKTFCPTCFNKKELRRVKVFNIGDKHVREVLDVFGYMDLIREVKNIKLALFNKSQRSCFHFYDKPTVVIKEDIDEETIERLQNMINQRGDSYLLEKKKVAEYFAFNYNNGNLTKIDRTLLKQLSEDVLSDVLARVDQVKEILNTGGVPDFNQVLLSDEDRE